MQSVGNAGSIAQMVVVVEDGVRECRGHMSYLLCLGYEVQCAMLNELQDIGHSVRTVQIHIALFLTDEGLVALRLEEFPSADEVLHHVDVRARLDVKIACIEESSDVQTRNQLVRLVFRLCLSPLSVQIEVVALRRLQITFLERLTMPGAIAFVHVHVVHVDGHPDIRSGIRNLVIHMFVDDEVVGFGLSVLDVIYTRLFHLREVKLHIVIFEVRPPILDGTLKDLCLRAVRIDAHQRGRSLWLIFLVEFYHCHLRLIRHITHL